MTTLLRSLVVRAAACAFLLTAARAAESLPLPPPVPGHPVGWCIFAKPETVADAKKAGYEYVELAMQFVLPITDEEFRTLKGQLDAIGIPMLAGYNVVPKEIMLVGPAVDVAAQDAHIKHVIARAAALKLTYLIMNSGLSWKIPDGFSRDEAFRQLADFGRRFAAAAAKENLTVLIDPLRPTDSNFITTIKEALAVVEAVKHPHFAMMIDYSFMRIGKDDVNSLAQAGRHLRHVHIANPDQNPRVYPRADGESDYAPFFRILKDLDYRGAISVHAGSKDPLAEAPAAIAFLRTKMRELSAK